MPLNGQDSYDKEVCFNLSAQNPVNLNGIDGMGTKGCPAHGAIGRGVNDGVRPGPLPRWRG